MDYSQDRLRDSCEQAFHGLQLGGYAGQQVHTARLAISVNVSIKILRDAQEAPSDDATAASFPSSFHNFDLGIYTSGTETHRERSNRY